MTTYRNIFILIISDWHNESIAWTRIAIKKRLALSDGNGRPTILIVQIGIRDGNGKREWFDASDVSLSVIWFILLEWPFVSIIYSCHCHFNRRCVLSTTRHNDQDWSRKSDVLITHSLHFRVSMSFRKKCEIWWRWPWTCLRLLELRYPELWRR